MAYDLFISYARRDNEQGRVTQFVERLQADFARIAGRELVVFFDTHDIQGMEDWRQKILGGLRESRVLLACVSPGYLNSAYCEWEFVEYLKYEIGHLHGFNGVAPVYFAEVPGWSDAAFEQQCAAWVKELRQRNYFDLRPWDGQGEQALHEAAVEERMGQLHGRLAEIIQRGERAEQSLGNVDAHNPHFIGRTANLRMLRENFVTPGKLGVITAVNGLGGLGKTALGIEYAHSFAHEYGGGRWQVRCAGKDDLRLALAELATPLGFQFTDEEKLSADLQLDRTRRELKARADARAPHRCLLLLDNVDRPALLDPADVARLNGGDWLHVLATTRLGENELHGAHRDRSFLPIDELPPEDALALIESYQPGRAFRSESEREAAREIVRLLGSFTLAVESAAVYLGQYAHDVTCAAFLARLNAEGLEGLDTAASQSSEGVRHGEKRLSATLQPTLERLGPAEKLALEFAALLPPDQVPLPWVRALVAKTFPEMEHDAQPGDPDPWKNVLRQLFSLRLLQPTGVMDNDGRPLVGRVHILMQELVLRNCPAEERAALQQVVNRLVKERNSLLEKTTRWEEARWELDPLTALAGFWFDTNHPDAAWLLNQTAGRWHHLAEWSHAEPLWRRALAIDETSFGPEHPNVAICLNNLGQLLQATNRLAEAEPLMRRVLSMFETTLGENHPKVAAALNNLAQLMKATNRLADAEPLLRRALAIDQTNFGPEHPEVATDLNNLAQLLEATNRLAEAEPLMRRALAIDETSFGPEHPNVAIRLNNLARLLQATNRLAEAEPLMRRVISIFETNLGENHPNVATALNNLALLLHATKRLTEAEPLMRRVISTFETNLGENHPSVATALNNLALLLHATKRLTEAEPLMRRALAIDEKSFGPEHPDLAIDLNNLATLLQATNRLAEAEPLMRRALAMDESSFGPEHPDVARDLINLAALLQDANRLPEAEPLLRQALFILLKFTSATAHRHPHLRTVVNSYASLLKDMGRSRAEILATLQEMAPESFSQPNAPNTSSAKAKIGRNEFCPCGSGKKFKRCCGQSG